MSMSFSDAGEVMLMSSSQTRGYVLNTVLYQLKTYYYDSLALRNTVLGKVYEGRSRL